MRMAVWVGELVGRRALHHAAHQFVYYCFCPQHLSLLARLLSIQITPTCNAAMHRINPVHRNSTRLWFFFNPSAFSLPLIICFRYCCSFLSFSLPFALVSVSPLLVTTAVDAFGIERFNGPLAGFGCAVSAEGVAWHLQHCCATAM